VVVQAHSVYSSLIFSPTNFISILLPDAIIVTQFCLQKSFGFILVVFLKTTHKKKIVATICNPNYFGP
jgi:hypothetical protein